MNEQLSLHVHIDVRTCGCTLKYGKTVKIINAVSQNQATSNVQQSAHLKLTIHVSQTFITCHLAPSLYLFFPEIPVNMFVLGECVGEND